MGLKERYYKKNLLITGTTGFLGKVLLEKFLYSIPDIKTIFILIRGKKGATLIQRFKKEILSSPCFDRLRQVHLNKFDQFIAEKVVPIEGDLLKDNLGLSEQNHKIILNTCHIIINCAASIDFNARIDAAIDSNIKGTLRMFNLAQQIKNLEIFTHISTCYVNCNLKGLIKQQIYDKGTNPEQELEQLSKLPLKQLIQETSNIIKGFPNTYTFTKNLCERILQNRKKDLPLCLIRPAIINTSYSQPFPGWMDSIAAAAALYLFSGLGIISQVYGYPQYIGDTIPVDIVVGNIIAATAYNLRNKQLSIYHVGSSDRNPVTWKQVQKIVKEYWNNNVSQNRVRQSVVFMSNNKWRVLASRTMSRMPTYVYAKIAPYLGNQAVKNVSKMIQGFQRADEINKYFVFFTTNQWIYESRKVKQLLTLLTQQERKQFLIDVAEIDMKHFIVLNNYGLMKYILKENVEMPTPQNSNLLRIREKDSYFSDINWAWKEGGVKMKGRDGIQFRSKVLSSRRVLQAIESQSRKRSEHKNTKQSEQRKLVQKEAANIASDIIGQFKMPVVRFLAWTLHKIFKKIYEKVNLNKQIFDTFREIQQKMDIPIVLMPTHRSYIDFLIVSYIFFVYKLKLPYIVTDQALLSMKLIPYIIRSSGSFFFKKSTFKKSFLYRQIFAQYIQRLLIKGNNLQFFLEGTRSRTGKILTPQFDVLQILVNSIQSGNVEDICLAPLTINYEKVLEGDTFPTELLGQQKVEESLLRIIKAIPLLKVNFGRVYVEFCDPIFLKEKLNSMKTIQKSLKDSSLEQQKRQRVKNLGFYIIHKMTEKLVIMSTGIVSAVLLMHRRGITQDLLIKTVNWLTKYIMKKGFKIGGINENSATFAVRNAMNHLSQITTKIKKSIFQLQISAGNQFEKILMLSYYRNTVVHAFLPQAFIGCALAAFGTQLSNHQGVDINRLHQQSIFLMNMLNLQYLLPYTLNEKSKFLQAIQIMVQNNLIDYNGKQTDKVLIKSQNQKIIHFYGSFLRPLIESYWSVLVYLMTICNSADHKQQVTQIEKFYNYIQWYMQSLYEQKVIENYEACSLQTIKNAVKRYQQMNLVKITYVSKKQVRIQTISNIQKFKELDSNWKIFLKNLVHNSITSPMDIARSSVIGADFSKL